MLFAAAALAEVNLFVHPFPTVCCEHTGQFNHTLTRSSPLRRSCEQPADTLAPTSLAHCTPLPSCLLLPLLLLALLLQSQPRLIRRQPPLLTERMQRIRRKRKRYEL